jgi:hypothetical protein
MHLKICRRGPGDAKWHAWYPDDYFSVRGGYPSIWEDIREPLGILGMGALALTN